MEYPCFLAFAVFRRDLCAMPSGVAFCFGRKEKRLETRIAAISIIVQEPASVETLNATLHDYAPYVLGRMGIPYREKGVSIICIAMDAPADIINALTGKIGRLPGVSAKAAYASLENRIKNQKGSEES